ncbi:Uncharacterised protein [Blautia obeum]|uniref:Uncharacterized protein n=1 Tax=Blautia obeum TaxID=40520 RepID=A0A564UC56_9FIRM|nr:Uncharacterised protein [Blautia obeum]
MGAVLLSGQHIGELHTAAHQVTELADVRRWDKAGLDHAAHIQVANPLGVLAVGFVALLRFRVFRVRQGDPTGLFKDIEYRNPVFPCGFHADIRAGVFRKPVSQIPQSVGKRGKASLLVLCPAIGIRDTDTGKYPGFVNVQSTAVFAENFESHLPPSRHSVWGGSAGTGHPAKSSRFERDKFTGCCHAPFVDALTGGRTI